jgi:hypothetical protein
MWRFLNPPGVEGKSAISGLTENPPMIILFDAIVINRVLTSREYTSS